MRTLPEPRETGVRTAPSPIPDMDNPFKKLVVMGDRVLVKPEEGEERTSVGLYLPPTAVDQQAVQSGRIVAVGPGTPRAEPTALDEEPWRIAQTGTRFVPMQAEVGDFAIFSLRKSSSVSLSNEAGVGNLQRDGYALDRVVGAIHRGEGSPRVR